MVDDAAWTELQAVLDRPPTYKPEVAKLLASASVLEQEQELTASSGPSS